MAQASSGYELGLGVTPGEVTELSTVGIGCAVTPLWCGLGVWGTLTEVGLNLSSTLTLEAVGSHTSFNEHAELRLVPDRGGASFPLLGPTWSCGFLSHDLERLQLALCSASEMGGHTALSG